MSGMPSWEARLIGMKNMRDHAKKLRFRKIGYAAGGAGSHWSISDLTGVKKWHLLVT
jgi:hypothetical protein